MEPRKYPFNNSTLTIVFGDIVTSTAEVIVSCDDTGISMGGGLSGYLFNVGGPEIRNDAQKKLPAQLGDVVVSTAGRLQHQKYVFHSLTINQEYKEEVYAGRILNSEEVNRYILQHTVDKCFRLLQALDLHSIAFPCIGAGLAHIPLSQIAEVMADAISVNLGKTQRTYQVELYLFDHNRLLKEWDYIDMFENFAVKSALSRMQLQSVSHSSDDEPLDKGQASPPVVKREDMNHRVFISYSRKDEQKVAGIKAVLEEYSIPYWIDKEGIYSGENYKEVIVDAIDTASVVLFVSSVHSNASINVVRELGYAVKQDKIIIPVLLDDEPYAKSIRLDIADIDQIDYSNAELARKKLVASLAYALDVVPAK